MKLPFSIVIIQGLWFFLEQAKEKIEGFRTPLEMVPLGGSATLKLAACERTLKLC